jgi:hypothetical protein
MAVDSKDPEEAGHGKLTTCPYCEEPIDPGMDFPRHWPDCPENEQRD